VSSDYGWIIDKDHLFDSDPNYWSTIGNSDEGTIGPSNISDEMMETLKTTKDGTKFRLYDDDGELYYSGRYLGELDYGDPLTDFGGPNAGCSYMKEYRNGEWEITIG
jgi:hypothetical protein